MSVPQRCPPQEECPVVCWTFTEGDLLPDLSFTYEEQNLTGYTITLHLKQPDGTVIIKAAIALDLVNGEFKFEWSIGDLVKGLNQMVEVQFVNPAAKPLTSSKFLIDVVGEIA